jgi:lipoprotein NlpI
MPRASAVPAVVTLLLALPAYGVMLLAAVLRPAVTGADVRTVAIAALAALVALWVLLAALLVLGGARGWMPRWAALAICVLVPLSGVAAFRCLVLSGVPGVDPHWPLAILAALPTLIAAYAFWAHFPRLHAAFPPTPTSVLVVAAMLALSAAPIAAPYLSRFAPYVTRAVARAAAAAGTSAHAPAAAPAAVAPRASAPAAAQPPSPSAPGDLTAALARLTPDSPLADYLPFLAAGGAWQRQALERARLLPDRQAQAEALLQQGLPPGIEALARLDLAPTPTLCRAFGDQLEQEAVRVRADSSPAAGWDAVADRLEIHLETMNWLAAAGCDLSAAVRDVAQTAAAAPATPERDRFLAALHLLAPAGTAEAATAGDPALCLAASAATPEQRRDGCSAAIRSGRTGFGRLAASFVSRGNAFFVLGDFSRAISDYTAALHFKPDDAADNARVLSNRANAEDAAGDRAAASADYDAAIRLDPTYATAFNNRGAAAEAHGEHERALPDFDQAIRLDPSYALAFANRGRAKFFLGRFADAAQDFAQAHTLVPTDGYSLLWRVLAQVSAGQAAMAAAQADAAQIPHDAWPWPLVAAYLREHDVAWAQQAALSWGADAKAQARQACEAAFYLGEKDLMDGAPAAARALLQQAVAQCPPRAVEAASARAELARMGR